MTNTIAGSHESLEKRPHSPAEIKQTKPRKFRALASAALHALPDEAGSLRATYRQAREDMRQIRELRERSKADPEADSVSMLDMVKYGAWRFGSASGYQVSDDMYCLPLFMRLKDTVGTPQAYLAVAGLSTGLAFVVGSAEAKAQKWKASAQGLDTKDYEGPMADIVIDAAVNSAAFNVMTTATQPRNENGAVDILTTGQRAAASISYGGINTGFYAGSTSVPGLNSWTAFGVSLAAMYQVKGTIRGYRERIEGEQQEQPGERRI